ncbi:MAG: hypothetical protein HZB68_05035 [Candidatus Aenigmarchaeota archaeon]|nr:hypothetical protein [Candidatus Aenigmarchaeota archaeon]
MPFVPKSREGEEMKRALDEYFKSIGYVAESVHFNLSSLEELATKLKSGYRVANHFLKETHGLNIPDDYVSSLLPICHSIEGYESLISSEMATGRKYGLDAGYFESLKPLHEKHNLDEIFQVSSRYDTFLSNPALIEEYNKSVSALSGSVSIDDIISFLPASVKYGVRDSDFSSVLKSLADHEKGSVMKKELDLLSSDPFYFGNIIERKTDADIQGVFVPIVGAFGSGGTLKISRYGGAEEASVKAKGGGTIALKGGKIYLDGVSFDPALLKNSFENIESYVSLWRRGTEILRGMNYYYLPSESRFSFGNISYEVSYSSAVKGIDRVKITISKGPEVSGIKGDIEFLKKMKGGAFSSPIKYREEGGVFTIDASAKPDILGNVSGIVSRKATKRAGPLEALEFINRSTDGKFLESVDYDFFDCCEFAHYAVSENFPVYFDSLSQAEQLFAAKAVFSMNDNEKISWLRDKYPSVVKKIRP